MITSTLSWSEVSQAALVGVMRHVNNIRRNADSTMPESNSYAGWGVHIEGAAGEMVVAKLLCRYWPGVGTFGGDDVHGLQVRTTSCASGRLIVHPKDDDNAPFVLVTGRLPHFVVRGWLFGRDAKRDEWWQAPDPTRRPTYCVPQHALRPIDELRITT